MKIDDYPSRLTGSSYYYVRTAWEDESTQLGQYRTLKGAIAKADANPGSHIYTGDGIAIYPEDEQIAATAEETVTVTQETEESTQDEPGPTQDEAEQADSEGSEEVVAAGEEAAVSGPDASGEDASEEGAAVEIAADEDEAEDGFPNDGNEEPILYGKTTTLVNIRDGCSLEANRVTVMRKGLLVKILEECGNGWYRIRCEAAECGYAYVSGDYLTVCGSIYTVQPADTLWKIAEKLLGNGTKYTEIKKANGLTSNVIRVGMVLLIP